MSTGGTAFPNNLPSRPVLCINITLLEIPDSASIKELNTKVYALKQIKYAFMFAWFVISPGPVGVSAGE